MSWIRLFCGGRPDEQGPKGAARTPRGTPLTLPRASGTPTPAIAAVKDALHAFRSLVAEWRPRMLG